MTRATPGPDCVDVVFEHVYPVGPSGQVALEDYARALTRSQGAESVAVAGDPARVEGLHLCAPSVAPRGGVLEDIEAFARDMADRAGPGLGWS